MPDLLLSFETPGENFVAASVLGGPRAVRAFSVQEGISTLFELNLMVRLEKRADLDLESLLGKRVKFDVRAGLLKRKKGDRSWRGICSYAEQIQAEGSAEGLSTYSLNIVPHLWIATQRRNYRVFQHLSVPEIVKQILDEWAIEHAWRIDRGAYPTLEYRVQYGESDYAFICRLLEEAGIAFTFAGSVGEESQLRLSDALTAEKPYVGSPVRFVDRPNQASQEEYITQVVMGHGIRPGVYKVRDHDFRRPTFELLGTAEVPSPVERRLEQYHYMPGASLVEASRDNGAHDQGVASARASRGLAAERVGGRHVSFATNVLDLAPGSVFSMDHHLHPALSASARLIVVEFTIAGTAESEWTMTGRAVFAQDPFRPPLVTPKPSAKGVECATVVGPPGEEIYTDEFGRVRVLFPWDREGKSDGKSSCWIRVSQGWAGAGFGALSLPRVGQEVLVSFFGADPDQPIIVGRVHNGNNITPYKLPAHRTRSTWRSSSLVAGGGYNEILFEDKKNEELVYVQAERDLRRLVKMDATEEIRGRHEVVVGADQHIVIKAVKRELVAGDDHLHVKGDQRRQVGGEDSLLVGKSRQEKIGARYALDAGQEIHLKAGTALIIEGAEDLTLKGPGGFIRIDASGVTIVGKLVNINSGGAPGSGSGASPAAPEDATEAAVKAPAWFDPTGGSP